MAYRYQARSVAKKIHCHADADSRKERGITAGCRLLIYEPQSPTDSPDTSKRPATSCGVWPTARLTCWEARLTLPMPRPGENPILRSTAELPPNRGLRGDFAEAISPMTGAERTRGGSAAGHAPMRLKTSSGRWLVAGSVLGSGAVFLEGSVVSVA